MSNVKGKGQRLIPEDLLRYLEAYKEAHPDPTVGGGANLDDIVDAQGNKRFVEGDGTPGTLTNFNVSYCKWSLSGTHLMLVCAGSVKNATILSNFNMAKFTDIPEYILDKIIPMYAIYNVEEKDVIFHDGNGVGQELKVSLRKYNGLLITFTDTGTPFSSTENFFRVQFDLLIDTDYE